MNATSTTTTSITITTFLLCPLFLFFLGYYTCTRAYIVIAISNLCTTYYAVYKFAIAITTKN